MEAPSTLMSYAAIVLKIMIASPTDVRDERSISREVIYDWNVVNSEREGIVLLPVGWETHAAPALGERPQALINKQVLQTCDLLVAIFWTRFGTSTGAAESGTVEEIREHLAASKPAMVYFSTIPTDPASVDRDQYNNLTRFKKSIRQFGIIEEYDSIPGFRDKFIRQLAQTINDISSTIDVPERELSVSAVSGDTPNIEFDDEAVSLLKTAASSNDGAVRIFRTLGGTHIQAGREAFGDPGNARSEAKWRRIISVLETMGCLEDRTGRGEILYVTDHGFGMADSL